MVAINLATITLLGAVNGARTRDPRLGKPMLYQLSYYRVVVSACEDTTFILMWVVVLPFLVWQMAILLFLLFLMWGMLRRVQVPRLL